LEEEERKRRFSAQKLDICEGTSSVESPFELTIAEYKNLIIPD
jgi:hypothetical protein